MARSYKRDSSGRFASSGSTRSGPKARMASRGTNRLTRDNAGKITGTGDGATARGGRLRTASGKQRGAVVARIGGGGGKLRGGKGRAKWTPTTNAKGQVTGMRNSNAPMPSREAVAKAGRQARATRNLNAAMKREGDGPNSKASRSASVAKRASAIYSGKVDPKAKTKARLTRTQDPEALRRRMKKMKDNTTAKPARAKARARKAKTPDDLLTQATRIEIRGRRMSRAARTGARDRQIESRAVGAAKAARARAFEMQKPKPESKTAKMKRERAARVKAREQAANASRLIQAARGRRR